jgi:hypothetical protein
MTHVCTMPPAQPAPVSRPVRVAGGRTLAAAALGVAVLSGCASTTPLGVTSRLPEGTLPPAKEVGPPVNIQPAPLGHPDYRPPVRRAPWGHGPGWYGPRCVDPFFCGPRWGWGGPSFYYGTSRGGSGFGFQHRLF